jgi:hypothetical protein
MAPWRERIAITMHLRFAPNGFITGVPTVSVVIDGPNALLPIDLTSKGVYGTVGIGPTAILVGGVVEAVFDARQVGQSSRLILVRSEEPKAELARIPIDFSRLE